MSTVQGVYKELNLVESVTADGDYPSTGYFTHQGDGAIAIYGTFDGASIAFVFFTEKPNGDLAEMPVSTDWTFSAAHEATRFSFPSDMPYKIRVSTAGASTDVGVNLHKVLV